MKKLVLILLPVFSFAQQKESLQQNRLQPSLGYEMKQSLFKNDTVNKIEFNVENYQKEAIRERRREAQNLQHQEYQKEQLRDNFLRNNQSKGKSNLGL